MCDEVIATMRGIEDRRLCHRLQSGARVRAEFLQWMLEASAVGITWLS